MQFEQTSSFKVFQLSIAKEIFGETGRKQNIGEETSYTNFHIHHQVDMLLKYDLRAIKQAFGNWEEISKSVVALYVAIKGKLSC